MLPILLLTYGLSVTTNDIYDSSYELNEARHLQSEKKKLINKLLGEQLETNIIFLPIASYNSGGDSFTLSYVGLSYKSFEISEFTNSYGELTSGFLYHRVIKLTSQLSINYFLGVLYGYNGKLANKPRIPFSETFLFKGNLNPGAGFSLDYKINKIISFHIRFVPNITMFGLRLFLD